MSQTNPTTSVARSLPPEPWGRKLRRAREDVAGLSMKEAAELARNFKLTSEASISRLEDLDALPTGGRAANQRFTAYVLLLAYRMDPTDFGLGDDDLPPGVQIGPRTTPDVELSPTIWNASKVTELHPVTERAARRAA